jgi:hypothetical protein
MADELALANSSIEVLVAENVRRLPMHGLVLLEFDLGVSGIYPIRRITRPAAAIQLADAFEEHIEQNLACGALAASIDRLSLDAPSRAGVAGFLPSMQMHLAKPMTSIWLIASFNAAFRPLFSSRHFLVAPQTFA